MKLVAVSDLHVDRRTDGVERFDEVAAAARQAVKVAVARKADLFAFLGDLANPDDGPDALRAVAFLIDLVLELAEENVPSILISGNHDVIEDSSGRTTLSPLRRVHHMVSVVETRADSAELVERVGVVCFPYPPVSVPHDHVETFRDAVAKVTEWKPRTGIVLAHATHVVGAKQGEETLEMPRGRAVSLPVEHVPQGWTVLQGHFHTPQVTPGGVIIPGSLARLTHGETHEPRFIFLEI